MSVTTCMKRNVISIRPTTSIREAATLIVKKHIGLLPVVDNDNKPVGVIGMRDLLKLEMPDFRQLCHRCGLCPRFWRG